MKCKLYFGALLVLLMGMFASCENKNKVGNVELSVKVSNITDKSANIDITASNDEVGYTFSVVSKAAIGDKAPETYIKDMVNSSKVDGTLEIKRGSFTKYVENLNENTDYVVFAVALDENLNVSDNIKIAEFKTLEPAPEEELEWEFVEFDLKVENVTANNVDYTVTSNDPKIPFFYDIVSEKVYTAYQMNTASGMAKYINAIFEGLASKYEMTVKEVYDQLIVYETGQRNYTTLPAASKLYAYAVPVDYEAGKAVAKTKPTVYEFTTPEPEESNLSIDIEIVKEAPFAARVKFIPSNDNEYYFYETWEAENVEFYGLDDQGIIDYFVKYWGDNFDLLKCRGEQFYFREDYLQNKEMIAIAFGLENGRPNTKLFKKTFHTLPAINPKDQTFDMKIDNVGAISAEIHYEPWDPTVTYAFELVEKSEYEAAADKKAFLQEYYNAFIDYFVANSPFSREQAIDILSVEGSYTYQVSYLDPETEYVAFAVAINKADATFLSEIATKEFKTSAMTYSDVRAEAHITEFYDGDELASLDESFKDFAGKAIFSFDTDLIGDVAAYYANLLGGDVTEAMVPDTELYAEIISQGVKNPTYNDILAAPFDYEFTIVSFAVDSEGNYGKIYREAMTLDRADAADPMNFFGAPAKKVKDMMKPSKNFITHRAVVPFVPEAENYDLRGEIRERVIVDLSNKTGVVITPNDLFKFSEGMVK